MVNTNKLKSRLVEMGYTQKDLAEELGIATATMNQKLNNVRPLKLSEAYTIANFLKILDSDFKSYFFAEIIA